MNNKSKSVLNIRVWATLAVIAAAIGVALLWSQWGDTEKNDVGRNAHANYSSATAESIVDSSKPRPAGDDRANETTNLVVLASDDPAKPVVVPMQPDEDGLFATLINKLSASDDPRERQALLEQAAAWLKSLPPDEAAAILLRFLESGKDFEVGMPFRVGVGGNLGSHPALRVAALDWLGQLAPEAAKEYARKIFESSDSADEWAVALRNYGQLTESGTDTYFATQVRRLLLNEEWLTTPTPGFAEAHDAVVFDGNTDYIPIMISSASKYTQYQGLCEMVMDSFVQAHRSSAISFIGKHMNDINLRPGWRSKLLARADARDAQQMNVIKLYLFSTNISIEEKLLFAKQFPLFSRFLADRLITKDSILTIEEEAEIYKGILTFTALWGHEAGQESILGVLDQIEERTRRRMRQLPIGSDN